MSLFILQNCYRREIMKLKSDFTLREIAGDYIVIPTGETYLDFGAVISLNETGAFLWNQLKDTKTVDELASSLVSEYGIDNATATADANDFIALLNEHGLICDD